MEINSVEYISKLIGIFELLNCEDTLSFANKLTKNFIRDYNIKPTLDDKKIFILFINEDMTIRLDCNIWALFSVNSACHSDEWIHIFLDPGLSSIRRASGYEKELKIYINILRKHLENIS